MVDLNRPCVLYARYSPRPASKVDDNGGPDSVSYQLEKCRQFAQLNDWEVVGEYSDKLRSGKSTARRPGLEDAISHAMTISGVLVAYSLSRVSRSTLDTITIVQRLARGKASLASTKEALDFDSPWGRAFFKILAAFAEMEREQIAERTSDAMQEYQRLRRPMNGNPAYGTMIDRESGLIVSNPQERQVIAEMLRLRHRGMGMTALVQAINDMGYRMRSGNKWSENRVRIVLKRAQEEYAEESRQ